MPADLRETDAALRRTPWLTFALALACAGAFFYARMTALEVDAVVDTHLASAEEYFRSHPYLEPPPLLERRISREDAAGLHAAWDEERLARSAPPIPERIQAREQAELDRTVEAAEHRIEELPTRSWGVRATERAPATFLTHVLFHGGWPHLIGNGVLLVLLGIYLEGSWGAAILSCVATASAIGGAFAFTSQNPGYSEPFIGTSGLLAGLFGAFLVRFAGARREVPFGLVLLLTPLVLGLPVWFGLGWSIARGAGGVSAEVGAFNPAGWALVGGFLAGGVAALVVRLLGLERVVQSAEADAELRGRGADPQLERALQERAAGNLDEAFNLLSGVLRRRPDDFAASLALWEVANDLGRPRAAAAAGFRVVREELQRGDGDAAVAHWLEVRACGLDADAAPALLMRVAPLLRDAGQPEEAARALRAALHRAHEAGGTNLAARVAREAAELDPATAREAIWQALGSLDLDIQERQELESLLGVIQPELYEGEEEAAPPADFEPVATVSAADLVAPGEDTELPIERLPETRPDPIDLDDRNRSLELVKAVPVDLDDEGLQIELEGGRKKRVRFDRVEAVAVAAVDGIGPRTVIVVDLVLNWMLLTAEPLRVIRLRTDCFDPRRLVAGSTEPLDALRVLVERLLEATDAIPLPDLQSARGQPFAAFQSLAKYQADVLMIEP